MADVVIKCSGKMKEIEIDPVSELDAELDEDLVEANEEDFTDVDELDADTNEKVVYQVWLLGRGEFGDVNEFTYLIDDYNDVEEAIKCYNFFAENEISLIKNRDENFYIPADVYSVDLVIEEVAVDEDGNEECFNIVRETNIKTKA